MNPGDRPRGAVLVMAAQAACDGWQEAGKYDRQDSRVCRVFIYARVAPDEYSELFSPLPDLETPCRL